MAIVAKKDPHQIGQKAIARSKLGFSILAKSPGLIWPYRRASEEERSRGCIISCIWGNCFGPGQTWLNSKNVNTLTRKRRKIMEFLDIEPFVRKLDIRKYAP